MHAFVRFQTADGEQHDVPHGGIVGRLGIAALRLGDARISEAHALVSLRGGALRPEPGVVARFPPLMAPRVQLLL